MEFWGFLSLNRAQESSYSIFLFPQATTQTMLQFVGFRYATKTWTSWSPCETYPWNKISFWYPAKTYCKRSLVASLPTLQQASQMKIPSSSPKNKKTLQYIYKIVNCQITKCHLSTFFSDGLIPGVPWRLHLPSWAPRLSGGAMQEQWNPLMWEKKSDCQWTRSCLT